MATVFQITDGTTTVDLWNGPLKLRDRTWTPRTPSSENAYSHSMYGARYTFKNYGIVVEQFDLVADTGNNAGLIQEINKLERLFEQARVWHMDRNEFYNIGNGFPPSLVAYTDTESPKRSLIYEASIQYPADLPGFHTFAPGKVIARINLSRHPLWETTSTATATPATKSSLGGYALNAGTGVGTAPSRIVNISLSGAGGGYTLANAWFGVRRNRSYSASFNPLLEIESGTNGTDTANAADAGASGGNKKTVTFVTTTLVNRASYTIAAGPADHYRGRYLVLCRMKLSAANTTVGVQLKYDFGGLQNPTPCEETYFSDTNWRLIELGEIGLPPVGRPAYAGNFSLGFQLWAERLNGSGNLDLDALVFIPLDGFCSFKNGTIAIADDSFQAQMYEDDDVVAVNFVNLSINSSVTVSTKNLYLPCHEGWLYVIAAERAASHVLTDQMNVSINYKPRWLSYRGA